VNKLILLIVVAACSSKKAKEPEPDACETQVRRLVRWSATLVAEGDQRYLAQSGLTPVKVDAAPSQQPSLPAVFVTEHISFKGQLVGEAELVEHLRGSEEVAVIIDEKVPWSRVATIGSAALRADVKRLRFIFAGTSRLAHPAPSWIDRELDELAKPFDPSKPAPSLEPKIDPPGKRKLFANCPPARDLMSHLEQRAEESKREKPVVLMTELPVTLVKCGCAEDINAIERWLWAMWGRDEPFMPQTSMVVELDATAPKLEINTSTAWSTAYKSLAPRAAF